MGISPKHTSNLVTPLAILLALVPFGTSEAADPDDAVYVATAGCPTGSGSGVPRLRAYAVGDWTAPTDEATSTEACRLSSVALDRLTGVLYARSFNAP